MPLAPRLTSTAPSRILIAERDDDADGLAERGLDLGLEHDLLEVRRADFLLALADEHEVDRQLLFGGLERVQRGEAGHLRALGVGGAAADHDLADAGTIDDASFERRRAPLLRVVLLHVVHEVDRQRGGRAVVERGEDAGLARGRDDVDAREPGVAGELRHVLGALRIVEVLGGDGRQRDPVAQPSARWRRAGGRSAAITASSIRLSDERVGSGDGHGRRPGHAGVKEVPARHVVRVLEGHDAPDYKSTAGQVNAGRGGPAAPGASVRSASRSSQPSEHDAQSRIVPNRVERRMHL